MKSRRHESLIPLSREHHYGLMLCLRIHQGLRIPQGLRPLRNDETWAREKAAQATGFLESDLAAHFKAEEEALFPAMRDFDGASELLSDLTSEHRKLEELADRMRVTDVDQLVAALGQFADLLEAHIRKEERELFPLYESLVSAEVAAQVGSAIKGEIGDAMQPRNPELLN